MHLVSFVRMSVLLNSSNLQSVSMLKRILKTCKPCSKNHYNCCNRISLVMASGFIRTKKIITRKKRIHKANQRYDWTFFILVSIQKRCYIVFIIPYQSLYFTTTFHCMFERFNRFTRDADFYTFQRTPVTSTHHNLLTCIIWICLISTLLVSWFFS